MYFYCLDLVLSFSSRKRFKQTMLGLNNPCSNLGRNQKDVSDFRGRQIEWLVTEVG